MKTKKDSKKTKPATNDLGPKRSQADNIVELLNESFYFDFFLDQGEDLYVSIWHEEEGYTEVRRCDTVEFKAMISKMYWDQHEKTPQIGAIRDALGVLHGTALYDGEKADLENRMRHAEDCLWYDLTTPNWDVVRIKEESWEVTKNHKPIFRREIHNKPQSAPEKGGDINKFLDFVNIADAQDELLLLVYLVTCFVPDFPHPMAYFYGPQGSAKSTMSRLLRSLIDPSRIDVSQIPDSERELDQLFEHHRFIAFDNVSFLGDKLSDTLCKAITGVSSSKRKLYTNDEYQIYSYQRCIVMNGINLLALKPDLLERSLLFELDRVDKTKRVYESDLWKRFEIEKPKLLGAIFTIISKAMRIKEHVDLPERPRMADFALWGYAIAEAMGRDGDDFICSYKNNLKKQTMEVLYEHPTASAVLVFMRGKERWEGTASSLLTELHFVADKESTHRKLPESANALSRSLAQVRTSLEEGGIRFSRQDGKERSIILEYLDPEKIENTDK